MFIDMDRRDFLGAAAALGVTVAAGAAGGLQIVEDARADEAADDAAQAEAQAAAAEGRYMDPVAFTTDLTKDEIDAMLDDEAEVAEDFVTESGKVVPAVYIRLRNHVNRVGIGVGSQVVGEDDWDVYMQYWSEEEAQAELFLPLNRFCGLEEFVQRSGMGVEESRVLLDGMADRGLIWRYMRGGMPFYGVMTHLPGYWELAELSIDATGTLEEVAAFNEAADNAYAAPDFKMYGFDTHRACIKVMPASADVVDGELAPYTDWKASLDLYDRFAVMKCQCRLKRNSLGTRAEGCDDERHPIETCVQVGEMADYCISIGVARELTREEAEAKILDNVDHGYVIEATRNQTGFAICGCHSDCCLLLGAYKFVGDAFDSMEHISDYVLQYDADACVMCGACADRCPMVAITMGEDGRPQVDATCVRCGQCGLVCPVGARTLKAKPVSESFELPYDIMDDMRQMAEVRMAQGRIVDFTGDLEAVKY